MTFDLVTTEYGPPALLALADTVRQAKAGEPLAPVTVVVPSNHVGVTARRQLASGIGGPLTPRGTGTIGVTFLTPYRLAELHGASRLVASGKRPVSTPVITAALRSALRAKPGVFAPVVDHPATEEALVETYAELCDLSPSALDGLAEAGPRAADVVGLYRATKARLSSNWYDETDLTVAARSALQDRQGNGSGEEDAVLGHLVVYLPQDLTRHAAALLRDAARSGAATVIAGLTGGERADRGVRRSLGLLGIGPEPSPSRAPRAWPVSASTTRIVTTSDADEEIRRAVEAIVDAARDGIALERMALLFPTREPYARLAHEHLRAAEIFVNGTAVRGLAERTYGQVVTHLLGLRDRGYRRHDVLGLLGSAPVRTVAGAPVPAIAWERLAREAGVVAGRQQWDDRLSNLAGQTDRRADDLEAQLSGTEQGSQTGMDGLDAEGLEHRRMLVDRYRRHATRARDLRTLVLELIDDIEGAAEQPRPWRERVRWLRRLTGRLIGGEADRQHWPEDERQAAGRVEAALDRLDVLDQVDEPCTLDVFRRTLELELEADLGRVGRFGEGVLVAPLSFGIGLDLDLVVVVGAAEGTLPARLADDSLLPDHERARGQGQLRLRQEEPHRQQRHLHAALSAAKAHVLTSPRGDLRGSSDRSLSRWLEEMVDRLADPVPLEHVPSFAHRVRNTSFPPTAQEHRLRMAGTGDRVTAQDAIVAAGRDLVAAHHSTRFTRFDGNLAGLDVRSPLDEVVSATRLEAWATCPHAYFMRHVLRVEPVEDPAEQLWISALDKGSLIHEVLERFIGAVLARPQEAQPGPDDPWSADDHVLMKEIATEVCAGYEARGVVGRKLFWRRDRERLLAELERFLLDDDVQRRTHQSRPLAAEMAFGLPAAELPAVEVPIAGGRRLRFRGSADRVDRGDDGRLRVIDYKTGRPHDYLGLSERNPDDRGTHLQLAVYGVAAQTHHGSRPDDGASDPTAGAPVTAEYWFVSDIDRLRTVGYPVTSEVLERVGGTLGHIVDGISAGVFPARPTAGPSDPFIRCRYCDPDGMGVADRRREWQRKRRDPAVAGYVELAEPDADDERKVAVQ